MSLEVLDLRKGAIREVGVLLDDALEVLRKDENQYEGALSALKDALKNVEGVMKQVDPEMDEGKIDLLQQKLVKEWLMKAYTAVQLLQRGAENNLLICRGKVSGMEQAVVRAKKLYDVETAKQHVLRKREGGPDETVIEPRAPGVHPGPSLKERRLAEEQSMQAPASGDASAEVASTPEVAPGPAAPIVVEPPVPVDVPVASAVSAVPEVSDPRVARALKRVRSKR